MSQQKKLRLTNAKRHTPAEVNQQNWYFSGFQEFSRCEDKKGAMIS
jgi:hypothetical protein